MTPRKTNESTDGHLSGEQMRSRLSATDRKKAVELAEQVGAEWRVLCQNEEPLMVELLLPEKLRTLLAELAKVTAS